MNDKKLLAFQTEEKLLRYIQNEPVNVGEKIASENELAQRFNVSRNTLREAVKILVSKGVLDVRRGSGTFVISSSTIDDDPLRLGRYNDRLQLALELFEVRLMLEPEIAAAAALNATEEDVAKMFNLCDEIEEIHRSGGNTFRKDTELHTMIARSSKNRVVQELIPVIVSSVYTTMDATEKRLLEQGFRAHRNIVNAIAKHDATGARCSMIEHFTGDRRLIYEMLHGK